MTSSHNQAPTENTHKLTGVYPLQLDLFLQVPSQTLLAAIFSQSSIIHQKEVGMETVETCPLTQGVSHRLVWSEHLYDHHYHQTHHSDHYPYYHSHIKTTIRSAY